MTKGKSRVNEIKKEIKGKYITAAFLLLMGIIQLSTFLPSYIKIMKMDMGVTSFLIIFIIVDLALIIVGIMIIVLDIRKKLATKRIIKNGNYILAEIIEIVDDYSKMINGQPTFVVKCQYVDSMGTVHIFKSDNLEMNPSMYLNNQLVKVYVKGDNFNKYHVDIEGSMQNIVYH